LLLRVCALRHHHIHSPDDRAIIFHDLFGCHDHRFYILRRKWDKETFEYKEASRIIKLFWVWSVIYVAGMFIAGLLISSFGDMTKMNEWTESVVQGTTIPDEESLKQVTQDYMDTNFKLIISMTILCILPAQIYAALRIKQGLSRIQTPPETITS